MIQLLEGIGRAMALELAKEGFNVIISARTLSKLQDVEKEIKDKYPRTEVKILVADYKKSIDWSYIT
jgi:short-subunit dehydrogenase